MNIVDAYRETGSYRAAGALCGVDHKTVKRVLERAALNQFDRLPAAMRSRDTDRVAALMRRTYLVSPSTLIRKG